MPELPEVETTKRGIAPHLVGKTVRELTVRNGKLRWPVPDILPREIKGHKLLDISRRGKYLLFEFERGVALWHLGMSGSLRILLPGEVPEPKIHEHVDLRMADGTTLRFNDPRRFGALLWSEHPVQEHELLAHLGPEPLTDEFNWEYLFQKSRGRKVPIKTFVMDSKVVVGVGNIYANEALWASGIKPDKASGKVTKPQYQLLVDEIKAVLSRAITQGGTTLRDFTGGDGKPGYFAQKLNVYGRGDQPCRRCAKPLKEIRIANRSTVYCNICQK